MTPDDLIGCAAAARLLAVSTSTIYRWRDTGELPCYRVGGRFRFSRRDVLAMVEPVESVEVVRTAGEDEEAARAAVARMRAGRGAG
jgi:excisionase family DNA binding protein